MARYNRKKIRTMLNQSDTAPNPYEKGRIFEDLVLYLFDKFSGIRLAERNVLDASGSQEIDLALWNNRLLTQFDFLDPIIICECKNDSSTLSSAKVGEYVKLTVEDSGKGISDKTIEHIFEPFFTTKDQGKGTGLGLAMVYGFVSRSGGFIECDSRLEVGTSFHLYLPRSTKENQFPEQSNGEARVIPKGQETILVVDDEPDLLKLAITLLERQGYHVLGASDGHAALKMLDEEPAIVLLFSDIVMPNGINGYELAEQATQKRHKLKVLLTSGYTEKVDLKDSQKIFTTNMLSKPYTQERLAKAIRSILDEQDS